MNIITKEMQENAARAACNDGSWANENLHQYRWEHLPEDARDYWRRKINAALASLPFAILAPERKPTQNTPYDI